MNTETLLSNLPGGQAIIDWFGKTPEFHDAEILNINLVLGEASSMRIHAWNMTDQVDSEGYFVTDKHAVIVVSFASVQMINLKDFDHEGIIFDLELTGTQSRTEVSWTSSYGAEGQIVGEGVEFALNPGRP